MNPATIHPGKTIELPSPAATPKVRSGRPMFAVIALLSIQAVLLIVGVCVHSPTFNEPASLAAGARAWQTGQFDSFKVTPPLTRLIASAPALLAGMQMEQGQIVDGPDSRLEFSAGRQLIQENGAHVMHYFRIARLACVPFCIFGGWLCFRWASDLYGPRGGLMALVLWTFSPSILAFGQLCTPELIGTVMWLLATFTFWRWLLVPNWRRAFVSGACLGLAELASVPSTAIYFGWPLLWLGYRLASRCGYSTRQWTHEALQFVTRAALALYVLNMGYGFDGSGTQLGDYRFVSAALGAADSVQKAPVGGGNRFADTMLAYVPLPLPKYYVLGADLRQLESEKRPPLSYLRGELTPLGSWYYALYAFAVKEPLGVALLLIVALLADTLESAGARLRDEIVLLYPALATLAATTMQTHASPSFRWLLPAAACGYIWIGRAAGLFSKRHWFSASVISACFAWAVVGSLWSYPHSLSYFNELAGGPLNGPRHLIQCNTDWGQDLLFLKAWSEKHPEASPLRTIYYGSYDPRELDVPCDISEQWLKELSTSTSPIPPGRYAVSVSLVQGFPAALYRGQETLGKLDQQALSRFRQLTPVDRAGYSIWIYHVEDTASTKSPLGDESGVRPTSHSPDDGTAQ